MVIIVHRIRPIIEIVNIAGDGPLSLRKRINTESAVDVEKCRDVYPSSYLNSHTYPAVYFTHVFLFVVHTKIIMEIEHYPIHKVLLKKMKSNKKEI